MFNAHPLTSSRALEMLEMGEMSDCVIEVHEEQNGGQDKNKKVYFIIKTEFNVHKLVLTVNSDVFRAMFSHKNTKECQESRIVIEDSTGTAVRQMLIYIYTDDLPTEYARETDAVPLLYIGNKYQIKPLVQLIERGLVKSLSLENVFDRLELAELYQMNSLYSSCGQLIRRKLKMVKKEAKWLELKEKAPELAFSILEDVDEFGNSNIFKTARNNMSTDQSNIKSRALEMFQSGQGADCVIEVVPQSDGQDKQEFNVHKFVLMVNSDVFHAMFIQENTKECQESRIVISYSTAKAVRQMLIYMYTGDLPTEYSMETDAGPLMHIANKYQIKSLIELIEHGLINSLSLGNVLDRLEMAYLYQIQSLYSSCGQLIRRNLEIVKKNAKWMELKKKAPELALFLTSDDDDEKTEEIDGLTFSHCFAAAPAATNIYHPTLKNERSWFLLLLVSYLAMCIPINGVVLVLVGWRSFFYGFMWIWSFPAFIMTIVFGHIHPFFQRPSWRHRIYFRSNFPLRLCVYWTITVLLSFLIIAFVLGRHYLLGDPPQLTTSPEAIFPSTLGLDCALNAGDDDAKVTSNHTIAADEVVARFSEALGHDDEAKEKMHECIKGILDDPLGDDKAEKSKKESKCGGVFLLLVIFGGFIVGIVDCCFIDWQNAR